MPGTKSTRVVSCCDCVIIVLENLENMSENLLQRFYQKSLEKLGTRESVSWVNK